MGIRLNRGSVLMLSVWFLALLSLVVSSLTFQVESGLKLVRRETESFLNHFLFLSGVHLAERAIESDPEPYYDSPLDAWYGSIAVGEDWRRKISIHVEDENAKLNLNQMNRTVLRDFFELAGEKDAGKAVLKWKEEKSGRKFRSLEELLTLEGITPKIYDRIKPYLTVYGRQPLLQVNINTVSLFSLQVILKSIPGDDFDKRKILERIRELREKEKPEYFREDELTPNFFLGKLKLTPDIQMIQLANQLLPFLTTDSNIFKIDLKSVETKAYAESIIEYRQDAFQPFGILAWHEE